MDALSEAILRLIRRQDETDRRLARIETALGLGASTAAAPVEVQQPQTKEPPAEPAAPIVQPLFVPAVLSDRPREFETQVGLTWISRIGAITLVFSLAFVFKYAIDN